MSLMRTTTQKIQTGSLCTPSGRMPPWAWASRTPSTQRSGAARTAGRSRATPPRCTAGRSMCAVAWSWRVAGSVWRMEASLRSATSVAWTRGVSGCRAPWPGLAPTRPASRRAGPSARTRSRHSPASSATTSGPAPSPPTTCATASRAAPRGPRRAGPFARAASFATTSASPQASPMPRVAARCSPWCTTWRRASRSCAWSTLRAWSWSARSKFRHEFLMASIAASHLGLWRDPWAQ
mmetsp:Transcript_2614/g.10110  ORF Transcript_2614/g.10110 Transcript_2614/m.10110 type:complete len:237 (-) Transcript_2614:34-744(-)